LHDWWSCVWLGGALCLYDRKADDVGAAAVACRAVRINMHLGRSCQSGPVRGD
jgi:hypothetical protein